jgi:hypothetical protein
MTEFVATFVPPWLVAAVLTVAALALVVIFGCLLIMLSKRVRRVSWPGFRVEFATTEPRPGTPGEIAREESGGRPFPEPR